MRRSVLLPSEITQLTIIFAFKYGSCFIIKIIIHFASCLQESRLNFLGPNNIDNNTLKRDTIIDWSLHLSTRHVITAVDTLLINLK